MKRIGSRIVCCLLGGLLLAGCESKSASVGSLTAPIASPSPTPTPTVDPRITDLNRIKVGSEAPDFSLSDQDGKRRQLAEFRGKKYVVLAFYRGYF
jgi:cytochrome oxidase Cu insertion factor (SCO1/SenC/PrrC family)